MSVRKTGIPTKYAGIQFRSRLEAQWAAFFDCRSLKWEYEPLDLKGYIPDFIILGKRPILLEVKPAFTEAELYDQTEKVKDIISPYPIIAVGATMMVEPNWGLPCVGYVVNDGRPKEQSDLWCFEHEAIVFSECSKCKKICLKPTQGVWDCNLCGEWCKHWSDDWLDIAIESDWARAKNIVQWKAGA